MLGDAVDSTKSIGTLSTSHTNKLENKDTIRSFYQSNRRIIKVED
jgi:hypothetical protein